MKTEKLNPDLVEKIEPELMAGEDLLWVGQPNPRRMMLNAKLQGHPREVVGVLVASLLGLLIGGFVAFRTEAIPAYNALPALVILLLMLMALAALSAPIAQYLFAKRTLYAITNRRAIIMRRNSVQSFGDKDMTLIERKMRGQSQGDIIFRYDHVSRIVATQYAAMPRREKIPVGFFGIDNVRAVEAMMLETFGFDAGYEKPKRLSDEDVAMDTDDYEDEASSMQDTTH